MCGPAYGSRNRTYGFGCAIRTPCATTETIACWWRRCLYSDQGRDAEHVSNDAELAETGSGGRGAHLARAHPVARAQRLKRTRLEIHAGTGRFGSSKVSFGRSVTFQS